MPNSFSKVKGVGLNQGYVIIRKITPTESPSTSLSPSSSLLPSSTPTTSMKPSISAKPTPAIVLGGPGSGGKSDKKKAKAGKTAPASIFS